MIDEEGDLSSSEEQERMTAIENHKLWIDAAHQMGCTAVRLNLHGEKEEAKWIKNSIESLSALSEYAAPFNINVIVENHGGKSSNANRPESVWSIQVMIRGSPRPRVGLRRLLWLFMTHTVLLFCK